MTINRDYLVGGQSYSDGITKMTNIAGIVIHNTAGGTDTALGQAQRVKNSGIEIYTHYFVDANSVYQLAENYEICFHLANEQGNKSYIGIEICEGGDFEANEQKAFELAAELIKQSVAPNNIRLHSEFSNTQCPAKSKSIHPNVLQYFKEQVNKHLGTPTPEPTPQPTPTPQGECIVKEYAENGTYFPDRTVQIYNSIENALNSIESGEFYYAGENVRYHKVYISNLYRYVEYTSSSNGGNRYVVVGKTGGESFGTFK